MVQWVGMVESNVGDCDNKSLKETISGIDSSDHGANEKDFGAS